MTDDPAGDAVRRAVDELYAIDPDAFMARRTELVAQARAAKDRDAAKRIGALRKPTRAAAALNHLVRRSPAALDELLELGDALRRAERSVDRTQIRQLSQQRRRLVDAAVRAALEGVDGGGSAALREDVTATLAAALADDELAARIRGGTMVKAAEFEGFGFPGAPDLSVVGAGRAPAARAPERVDEGPNDPTDDAAPPKPGRESDAAKRSLPGEQRRQAAQEREEQQRARERRADRRKALDAATSSLDTADDAATAATRHERELRDRVRALEDELYDARRELDEARAEVKRTGAAQREARLAVDKLEMAEPD